MKNEKSAMYRRGRGWSTSTPLPFNPSQPARVAACGASEQQGRKTCSSVDDDKNMKMPQPHSHDPFDICPRPSPAATVVLKPPLLVTNRERRKQGGGPSPPQVVRPGMILLKSYISLSDQVSIVKICRELGMGSGGFYQPGYGDVDGEGTKLHLKMMCLGRHWDPLSSQYTDYRPSDGDKPPQIPPDFHRLVRDAIAQAQAQAQAQTLPPITPDICIVNFYSQSGRLGLHQDKDESQESLRQGLPVVSFSIGDSADFLYGDSRDVDKAQKLELQSGDVLIFGGKSRNVFHGVSAIHQNTAPNPLLQQTNLRSGRLNLTFRQF
ncbi:hypothetical protein HN51_014373 [Arachis hypogaea]|uniref:Fe2OG dioxygenase domain-containing protein n=1 Tax=Arachis hypogaea TaxID=3818 RepID=A0A445CPQ7_ARAHY|nr:uncharacterized protein LOC112695224 [Arachis hypogaea]QHO45441.1 Alpha-ketoglutarate-dependent dioxygenase AlkB [Arachis hypogaea]RYR52893.1 hypothetical protein Ahy_A06g027757 isoform A [Arachis hypogaea]RYR52894.1 hypothetical protein Ahy_A06g027757 isoform B [Arachis hypogaea]